MKKGLAEEEPDADIQTLLEDVCFVSGLKYGERSAPTKKPRRFMPGGAFLLACCCHPAGTHKVRCPVIGLQGLVCVVSQAGFEPATFPLGGGCSIQLTY